MKRRTLVIFGMLTVWVYVLAWFGKQQFPSFFNKAWIQYGSAIFTALACPLGALFALKLIHEGDRWNGFWLMLTFCVPVAASLTVYGIGGPMISRMEGMARASRNDYGAIARISEFCVTPEMEPAKRLERAAFAYQIWAIKLPVMYKDGSIALFVPNSEDEKGLKGTIENWRIGDQVEKTLDDQLRQMQWLFGLYLGSWFVVFVVGLGWFAFRGSPPAMAQ
jgi:hypothetical protein